MKSNNEGTARAAVAAEEAGAKALACGDFAAAQAQFVRAALEWDGVAQRLRENGSADEAKRIAKEATKNRALAHRAAIRAGGL